MADPRQIEVIEPGSEQRLAERATLALPAAKLVCQSGEYVCRLRDVSTLGVGLTFLHAVPPEPRIILQLAGGATYPIERVWIGKRQAGYRFGCEVALADFTARNSDVTRRALALKVSAPAQIKNAQREIAAQLIELACDGARVTCETTPPKGRLLGFELGGLAPQLGEVRWQDGKQFHLHFQHRLTVEELAQCALHLQPFATSLPSGFANLLSAARAA
jgi:hypothetical protein